MHIPPSRSGLLGGRHRGRDPGHPHHACGSQRRREVRSGVVEISRPLTGKTILASAGFFVSWLILHVVLRRKDPRPKSVFVWTGVLIAIGLVLTFPTLFQAFAPEE